MGAELLQSIRANTGLSVANGPGGVRGTGTGGGDSNEGGTENVLVSPVKLRSNPDKLQRWLLDNHVSEALRKLLDGWGVAAFCAMDDPTIKELCSENVGQAALMKSLRNALNRELSSATMQPPQVNKESVEEEEWSPRQHASSAGGRRPGELESLGINRGEDNSNCFRYSISRNSQGSTWDRRDDSQEREKLWRWGKRQDPSGPRQQ